MAGANVTSGRKAGWYRELAVEGTAGSAHGAGMAMSVDQLVSEARHLSGAQVAELLDRLLLDAVTAPDVEVDALWRREVADRVADIDSGREPGVDGDQVLAELRRIAGR